MNDAVNAIMAMIQIGSVVGAGVWVVATIKGKVDTLVSSIDRLTGEIDKLTKQTDIHSGDIKALGRRVSALEKQDDK